MTPPATSFGRARPWWAVALFAAASGCGIVEADAPNAEDELSRARALWVAAGIDDYDLVLRRLCFCASIAPVRVEVREGRRVATVLLEVGVDGTVVPLAPELHAFFPPVEGLFEIVDRGFRERYDEMTVTYDPRIGVPIEIQADPRLGVDDDEFRYEVELVVR